MRWWPALLATALGAHPACAADPILVPEVSQHDVQLRQGFSGTELLLFGALLTPEGTRAVAPDGVGRASTGAKGDKAGGYDIVVVLKGPTQAVTVREKQRLAGLWINAASISLRSAPSFYALASSRPLADIVDDRTAAIYELGLKWLQLSPIGAIEPAEQARFAAGLVGLRRRAQLYRQQDGPTDGGAVTISQGVLYHARIPLPSNLPTGSYTAETFAIVRGRVVTSATSEVTVRKIGAEEAIANFAQHDPLLYGAATIALAVTMGWLAGRLLAVR